MSKSKLIYEYLDQGLDDMKEDMLFSSLNENKEMREEFYNLIKLDKASFTNFAQTTVPASATNALFANMGLELPLNENVKNDKDKTPVGFIASIGSLSLFTHFRDYVSAFLGLLIGGMLTALIFNFTNLDNNTSDGKISNNVNNSVNNSINGSSNNTNSNNSKSQNPNSQNSTLPLLIDKDNINNNNNNNNEELNNRNGRSYRNNKVNSNNQNYLTASNSNNSSDNNTSNNSNTNFNLTSNSNSNSNFKLDNINLNQSLIDDIKTNLGGGITINLNENLGGNLSANLGANTDNNLSVFNLEQYNNTNNIIINQMGNNITIINELTEQTRDAIFKENILFIDNKVYEDAKDFNDFTLTFKGIGSSNNSYSNQIQSFSNNIRLGLLYSVANNHYVGIELGNEQFVLPTQINQLDKNYQNKSTYFVGANYKYDITDLEIMKGIYPSIGTSINFATIGTIMRGNIGINLKPESRLSFGIYYEPSILFNNYRSLSENYVKNNVVFGVSYKIE